MWKRQSLQKRWILGPRQSLRSMSFLEESLALREKIVSGDCERESGKKEATEVCG